MAKINLLKQKWVGTVQVKRLQNIAKGIAFLTIFGFLLQTFYITGRLVYVRFRTRTVRSEIKLLDRAFVESKSSIVSHVWAQGVLDKMAVEKAKEYKYKDYLMEINSWLTEGTSLVGVSFTQKDEITFLVFAKGIDNYRDFETGLVLRQNEEGFSFKAVEQVALIREPGGGYKVKIRLKI
jgi:hypothetical protein